MAASYNKTITLGNLTRDPELKHTTGGTAVCEFGIAVNEKYKDKETVTFIDITAFGRTAEVVAEYARKGQPLLVDGKLQRDEWEDRQTGQKRSKLKVVAERIQLLGSRGDGQRNPASRSEPESKPDWATEGEKIDDDDVPF